MQDRRYLMRNPHFAFLLLMAVALAGCGRDDSLRLATVTGAVTYRGKPLDHGTVVFTPKPGTPGPQSVGEIDANGKYRMRTAGRDGAPVGSHVVTVHCRRQVTPEEARRLVIGELLIPAKYANEVESPFQFNVKEGRNEYPITLE
jgi:hypothetical protein